MKVQQPMPTILLWHNLGEKNSQSFVTQRMVEKDKLFVVGLSDGYGAAVKIVEVILNEVLQVTGGTDIRNYLLKQQMEYEKRNG